MRHEHRHLGQIRTRCFAGIKNARHLDLPAKPEKVSVDDVKSNAPRLLVEMNLEQHSRLIPKGLGNHEESRRLCVEFHFPKMFAHLRQLLKTPCNLKHLDRISFHPANATHDQTACVAVDLPRLRSYRNKNFAILQPLRNLRFPSPKRRGELNRFRFRHRPNQDVTGSAEEHPHR